MYDLYYKYKLLEKKEWVLYLSIIKNRIYMIFIIRFIIIIKYFYLFINIFDVKDEIMFKVKGYYRIFV